MLTGRCQQRPNRGRQRARDHREMERGPAEQFQPGVSQRDQFTPRVVVAMVVVLVVGYIAARLIGRIITLLCEKIGLQRAAEHSGLAQSMQHMGIKRNVSGVVGTIVFWLLMCVFLMAAFNILELHRAVGRDGRRSSTTFRSCWWRRWSLWSGC